MKLPEFFSDRKGQMMQGTVLAIVISAVLIIVGLMVYSNISTNMPTSDLSADAQAAINATDSMTYNAFNLLPIGLLVMAAVFIIGVVMMLGGPRE